MARSETESVQLPHLPTELDEVNKDTSFTGAD